MDKPITIAALFDGITRVIGEIRARNVGKSVPKFNFHENSFFVRQCVLYPALKIVQFDGSRSEILRIWVFE